METPLQLQSTNSVLFYIRMTVHLWLVNKGETNYMQQLVILLVISCSWTCFGRLYAHHQEVRLRFTAYGFLSCKRKSVWSVVLWRVELYCIVVVCVYAFGTICRTELKLIPTLSRPRISKYPHPHNNTTPNRPIPGTTLPTPHLSYH